MPARTLAAVALFVFVGLPLFADGEGQRLAMLVKPAVVRVADGYYAEIYYNVAQRTFRVPLVGFGSGAFIDPNGYIATNAHVTQRTHDGDEAGRTAVLRRYVRMVAESVNVNPDRLTRAQIAYVLERSSFRQFQKIQTVITPNGDRLPFDIKAYGAPVGEGKDVCIIKVETKNAPVLKLGDSDQIRLQDHVTVVGYPAAADTEMLDERSALEASITDGKVSARKATSEGAPVLQISAPATHGNSGGPVVNDRGDVIGLLTFRGDTVNGQEVQGFSFVVAASTVQEFVKQAGANNVPGPSDTLWREGLDLFGEQKYKLAIEKFEDVRRLYPQHSEATRLISEAQQEVIAGHDRSSSMMRMVLIGGAVGFFGLLAVTILVLVLMSRGKTPAVATPVHSPQPPPYAPPPRMPVGANAAPPPDMTVSVPIFGTIQFTTGPLAGRTFEIRPDGVFIGRDASMAEIIINDSRISKRHLWIGPKNDRIVVVDAGSTNGTYLNMRHSARIKETAVRPGDVVILSDDVARFQVT
ncbi:MAG TPA: trypsin-like peptidase domain-containing protein [Thermoanaerobaculia bacterium]|jgi:V8-like Glu-specific endopeptidase